MAGVAERMQALYGTFVLPLDHLYTAQQTMRYICGHLPDLRRIIGCEGHIFITSTGNALQTLMLTLLNDGGQSEPGVYIAYLLPREDSMLNILVLLKCFRCSFLLVFVGF